MTADLEKYTLDSASVLCAAKALELLELMGGQEHGGTKGGWGGGQYGGWGGSGRCNPTMISRQLY